MQKPINNILLAFDYSDPAAHAAWIALAIGRSMQASLTLFHLNVKERARRVTVRIDADALPSLSEETYADLLNRIVGEPAEASLRSVFDRGEVAIAPATFSPAEEITGYAEEHQTDLIVIGANVHSTVHDVLKGSVASDVLKNAKCSVTVVH